MLAQNGLTVENLNGQTRSVPADDLECFQELPDIPEGAVILVCVKSMDTETAGRQLAQRMPQTATVLSFQNGLDNTARLKAALPHHPVLSGMVAFNVINPKQGSYKATTEGGLYVESGANADRIRQALEQAGLEAWVRNDMPCVQWSKLILNLNNGLNALSGQPLAVQLRNRDWRRLLAACMSEALMVMKARGIRPVRIGKVKPQIVPWVLRLPNFFFEKLASQMLRIDPQARSSMADDFALGRPPEIDYLNGEISRQAQDLGLKSPANQLVTEQVHALFAGKSELPLNPQSLLRKLGL